MDGRGRYEMIQVVRSYTKGGVFPQFEHVECFCFYKCNLFGGHTLSPRQGWVRVDYFLGILDCGCASNVSEGCT